MIDLTLRFQFSLSVLNLIVVFSSMVFVFYHAIFSSTINSKIITCLSDATTAFF